MRACVRACVRMCVTSLVPNIVIFLINTCTELFLTLPQRSSSWPCNFQVWPCFPHVDHAVSPLHLNPPPPPPSKAHVTFSCRDSVHVSYFGCRSPWWTWRQCVTFSTCGHLTYPSTRLPARVTCCGSVHGWTTLQLTWSTKPHTSATGTHNEGFDNFIRMKGTNAQIACIRNKKIKLTVSLAQFEYSDGRKNV